MGRWKRMKEMKIRVLARRAWAFRRRHAVMLAVAGWAEGPRHRMIWGSVHGGAVYG